MVPRVVVLGFVFFSLAAPASAQTTDRLVLLSADEAAPRPGFGEALRIQLVGTARVVDGPTLPEEAMSERLARASAAVRAREAVLGVWVEPVGDGEVVLYAVGPDRGRAVVEVARLEAASGPEFDRALALKVRDILDGVRAARESRVPLAGGVTTAPQASQAPSQAERPPALTLAGGLGVASPSGSLGWQLGADLRVGWAFRLGPGFLEPALVLGLPVHLHTSENDRGRVVLGEVAPAVRAAWWWPRGPLALGGHLAAGARVVHASGTTPLGSTGAATRVVPFVAVGAEVRLRLRPRFWLQAELGGELAVRRQRFSVNRVVFTDLGRVRGRTGISVVISTD